MSIVKATAAPLGGGGGGLITWPSTSHSPSIRLSPKHPLWLATRFLPPSSGRLKATGRQRSLVHVTKPGKLGGGALGAQMNLFDRLARVIKSYANSFISSVEDPEKILEQTVLEMNDDLIKLRQATAQVLASQKQLENKYKAAQQASDDWYRRAQLALERGEEDLAREALKRRKSYAMNALGFLNFRTRNIILHNGRIYECSRHFCHMVEQPELPSWIKSPENASPLQTHSDDDFILPGTKECKEIQINDSHTSNVFSDSADHVDKISRILNSNHYDFSEDVVRALNAYGIVLSDGTMVGKLLKRFSNNWVPAFGFFRWADERAGFNLSVEEYNLMVDILGKASQFDIMWILVQELVQRGNIVSLITVSKIMRRLARAGRYSDAIDTFSRIECLGLCKDTTSLNLLLDALCKERSVENAYGVFLVFKAKIPPDAHSFNILIHGWSKAKKFEEAHATMEEMRFHGFQPSIISYTALIEAYCDDRNFDKVDSILKEMRAKHCPPNIVTYTVIMHALGKAKQTKEALCILQMIKEDGCTSDASFYNSLIYILGKAGRLQDVREIFNEMCGKGIPPDVTTYNTMISCACDYSQEEKAILLLRKMAENLCKPDIKTYAPLLKLCCKKHRWETLQFLLKDMLERDISLDRGAYTLLTNSLCRSSTLQQACMFFEQMVLKGFLPSHNTYYLLEKKLERKNMKAEKRRIQELISSLKAQILLY